MSISKRVVRALLVILVAIMLLPTFGVGISKAEDSSSPSPSEIPSSQERDDSSGTKPDGASSALLDRAIRARNASHGGLIEIMPLAIPSGCPTCNVGTDYGGSGWAGNYLVDGLVAYCVDPHKWYPSGLGNYTNQGSLDTDLSRLFGWLTAWYSNPSEDEAIAISMLAAYYSEHFGASGAGSYEQWNYFGHLQGLANDLWAQGSNYSGPYHIGEASVWEEPSAENGYRLTAVFKVANNHGFLDWGFWGQEWFDVTATSNLEDLVIAPEGYSGRIWISATVQDTTEPWEVWGQVNNRAPGGVELWTNNSGNPLQNFISPSRSSNPSAPKAISGGPIGHPAPVVSTRTSAVLVNSVGSLTDFVTVKGEASLAGLTFTGKSRLYGPFASNQEALSADVQAMTPLGIGTWSGTYDPDGTATVESTPVSYTKQGFYVWVEELDATDLVPGVVQDPKDRGTETSLATQPTIASLISDKRIVDGSSVSDAISLTGLAPAVGSSKIEWTLTGGLYGPITPGVDGSCNSADWSVANLTNPVSRVLSASEIKADGTAALTSSVSGEVTAAQEARCVSYGWILTGRAADGSTVSAEHAPGDPDQTGVITFQPRIATQAQEQVVAAADLPIEVRDHVIVSEGVAGRSFSGRTVLYGPFATDFEALNFEAPALNDSGEAQTTKDDTSKLVGIAVFDGVYDAVGRAEFTTAPVTITELGYYLWVEELFERPDGGEPVNPSEACQPSSPENPSEDGNAPTVPCEPGEPRRPSETFVVIDAAISTQISEQSVQRGSVITDDVEITGLVTRVGNARIDWSADVHLFGPLDPNSMGKCEDLDWTAAELIESTTIEVTDEMIDENGRVTLTDVGEYIVPLEGENRCLTYGETLTGVAPDGSVVKYTHEPGEPSQTTLVFSPNNPPTAGAEGSKNPTPGLLAIALITAGLGIGLVGFRRS